MVFVHGLFLPPTVCPSSLVILEGLSVALIHRFTVESLMKVVEKFPKSRVFSQVTWFLWGSRDRVLVDIDCVRELREKFEKEESYGEIIEGNNGHCGARRL